MNYLASAWNYDGIGRLSSLSHDLASTARDVTYTFTSYNASSQLLAQSRDNDAYAWTGASNFTSNYTANGLNQYSAAGSSSLTYDANGNLTSNGTTTYAYDRENRLLRATGASTATLVYDPLGRLFQTSGGAPGTTQFLYDGDALVSEYNGANALQRRYVHGSGVDEPLVWYEGANLTVRRLLRANHQGSIVALADSAGTSIGVGSYDEYGNPAATNQGRFAYTGQIVIPELALYYYKARLYSPSLGRFMQTDPVGYDDGMNWYNYAGSDPINRSDPSGMGSSDSVIRVLGSHSDFPWDWNRDVFWAYYELPNIGGIWGGGDVSGISEDDNGNPVVTVSAKRPSHNPPHLSLFDLGMASWTWQASVLGGGGGAEGEPQKSLWDRVKELYCSLPSLGVSGSGRAYDVFGGGVVFSAGFDPKTGRLGVSGGPDVGIGFGGEAGKISWGTNATAGQNIPDGWSASVGVSGNFRLGPVAGGASETLIGRNGVGFGGASAGLRPGWGATINGNLGVRGGYGGKIVPGC